MSSDTLGDSTGEPGGVILAFTDLPEEVLGLMVSLGLPTPRDVASFAAVSKRCAAVCRAAPLRMGMAVPAMQGASSPREEQEAARAALQAVCTSWQGTAELDLRGTQLEDADVLRALDRLPSLEVLQLSGCKKLTPALAASLARRRPQQLRTVTMQRCFQLTAAALTDVMCAAARPGSKLACVALSHLSLGDWPPAAPPTPAAAQGGALVAEAPPHLVLLPPPPPMGSHLRSLALHNCAKVSGRALQAVAAACPRLEVLMLGGSAVVPADEEGAAGCTTTTGAGAPAAPSGDRCGSGSGAGAGAGSVPKVARLLRLQAQAAASEGALGLGGGFGAYVAGVAAELALTVYALPRLRVLELTFGLPGLVPLLQRLANTEPLLAGRPEPLQVWDLCTAASLAQALQWRCDVRARYSAAAAGGPGPTAAGSTPGDAAALLSAAVNCSSAARQTPLHAAAEEANPSQIQALLGLGAQVDARDRSGATPLFAACEAGHVRSVECLLAAGASVTLRNSAGEAPLYIAALKGHARVVDLLLQHCQERGIVWQAQALYDGDGWTPLMAAAVGGRTAIVLKLLEAAGPAAAQLVQAANRYGQTAVHIAARKGSASLLRTLVDAGGTASLLTADCEGKTAAEIARRNGNGSAMRVLDAGGAALRREQQRQRSTFPTAERPRPHDRQQQGGQRWVGRRLQQRKGASGGGGGQAAGH